MKQGQETNQIWTHEAGTHDTHDRGLTLLPPPERLVPSLNSSIREGGWVLWRPLRTNTDRNTGRGPPERNRQTGTMAELGALEAMAVQGAQVAMAELGAQVTMAELGALEAIAELGALEAMADGLCGRGLGPLGPAPTAGTLLPPKKNVPGEVRGYQEPSGARHRQDSTKRQESPPGPDRQDRTSITVSNGFFYCYCYLHSLPHVQFIYLCRR